MSSEHVLNIRLAFSVECNESNSKTRMYAMQQTASVASILVEVVVVGCGSQIAYPTIAGVHKSASFRSGAVALFPQLPGYLPSPKGPRGIQGQPHLAALLHRILAQVKLYSNYIACMQLDGSSGGIGILGRNVFLLLVWLLTCSKQPLRKRSLQRVDRQALRCCSVSTPASSILPSEWQKRCS